MITRDVYKRQLFENRRFNAKTAPPVFRKDAVSADYAGNATLDTLETLGLRYARPDPEHRADGYVRLEVRCRGTSLPGGYLSLIHI